MDRFKEDFERFKEIEKQVTDNLKERQRLVKVSQSTTKVRLIPTLM